MNIVRAAIVFLGIFLFNSGLAQNGPPGGKKGRGENSSGILTVLTQQLSVPGGLYSDQESNIRYYPSALNGIEDPDNPGTLLADGDCVVIVTPAADGVDNGKLVLFAPFGPNACTIPGPLRQLKVIGSGQDLNGIDGATDAELIDARFGCNDVFPLDSPVPGGITSTSCSLEVRKYDESDEFERTWIIEWSAVSVAHIEADLRQLDSSSAEVFELVARTKGNGKKDKLSRGVTALPFRIQIVRRSAP